MLTTIRKSAVTVAALGAFGLGGAALAGAADNSTSTTNSSSSSNSTRSQNARPPRDTLSGDAAAKVKAAALKKVPGATVLRTEAGGPYNTPYHAHIRKSDGTLQVVLVNSNFEPTSVQADRGRGRGPGGKGGRGGAGETALTGETKQKVEDAVKSKYAGATILRTETNNDSTAPYESHIRTSDGKEFEVLVSKDFEVVDAREHPARP